jgi:glycosyltransferase involved in cell wall biosynthesis
MRSPIPSSKNPDNKFFNSVLLLLNMKNAPAVTIVMSVFNGEKYLRDAINSILTQTYQDFCFLIIDDASIDGTAKILSEYVKADHRIEVYSNSKNLGLAQSLNTGIALSRGKYIARMDGDDIAHPKRLEWQIMLMERHPELIASSTGMRLFGERSVDVYFPDDPENIHIHLLLQNVLCHPSAIIRRDPMMANNVAYSAHDYYAEDYGLWVSLSKIGKIGNIKKILHYYRWHQDQASQSKAEKQLISATAIVKRQMADSLGIYIDLDDAKLLQIDTHRELANFLQYRDFYFVLNRIHHVFSQILDKNTCLGRYNQKKLLRYLNRKYLNIALLYGRSGVRFYIDTPILGSSPSLNYVLARARLLSRETKRLMVLGS